jgi:hypothetical protein
MTPSQPNRNWMSASALTGNFGVWAMRSRISRDIETTASMYSRKRRNASNAFRRSGARTRWPMIAAAAAK